MTEKTENIQTDDDFDDDTPYTADTLRQENQRFEEQWAAENRQEEEQLRKATDADGNFKSLAHKMRYSEQEFPQWLPKHRMERCPDTLLRQVACLSERWHFHISLEYRNKIDGCKITDK